MGNSIAESGWNSSVVFSATPCSSPGSGSRRASSISGKISLNSPKENCGRFMMGDNFSLSLSSTSMIRPLSGANSAVRPSSSIRKTSFAISRFLLCCESASRKLKYSLFFAFFGSIFQTTISVD